MHRQDHLSRNAHGRGRPPWRYVNGLRLASSTGTVERRSTPKALMPGAWPPLESIRFRGHLTLRERRCPPCRGRDRRMRRSSAPEGGAGSSRAQPARAGSGSPSRPRRRSAPRERSELPAAAGSLIDEDEDRLAPVRVGGAGTADGVRHRGAGGRPGSPPCRLPGRPCICILGKHLPCVEMPRAVGSTGTGVTPRRRHPAQCVFAQTRPLQRTFRTDEED